METIILYKSFLGSTKTYAEWLQEELNADIKDFGRISNNELQRYELVIVSSGTYATYMPLVGFLKSKWEAIKDKRVIVVAVGAAPEDDEWSQKSYNKIPANIREKIKYFKITGRIGKLKSAGEVKKENLDKVIQYIRSINS